MLQWKTRREQTKRWINVFCVIVGISFINPGYAENVAIPLGVDPVYAKQYSKPASEVKDVLVERVLTDEVRQLLGLNPEDLLVATTPTQTIIFTTDQDKAGVKNQKVLGGSTVKQINAMQASSGTGCYFEICPRGSPCELYKVSDKSCSELGL